jgi:catechol O-methyltransferase
MHLWRFLLPSALGFTVRNAGHALVDKVTGAPARTVQAAEYVSRHAHRGDPEDVLRALDRFAIEKRWLMSVGPEKGPLIEELAGRLPRDAHVLELGAYCGYSSILIAKSLGPDSKVLSVEINADAVASARANVEVAGLSEQITFLHGPSTDIIRQLDGTFDLVFLDHWKDLYTTDLQLIEKRRLIKCGSIVVADNVGEIFSPHDYLNYVRNSGRYHSENRAGTIEYTSLPDAVEISEYTPQPDKPAH